MGATAGIILIGDEILSGKVADENARFLIEELRELGVALRRVIVIPDVLEEIEATVRELSARYDHVFTSGGVGPTHDDLTMEGVARAFGDQLVRHPELEQLLRDYYGAKLEERNLRMAEVPHGAHLVQGETPSVLASWPVIARANVYILPGVPDLFRRKFKWIRERFREAPYFLRRVFSSAEEGTIAVHLDAVVARFPGVQIGSYPRFDSPEYRVQVTLEAKAEDQALVEEATAELVRRLDSYVVRTS